MTDVIRMAIDRLPGRRNRKDTDKYTAKDNHSRKVRGEREREIKMSCKNAGGVQIYAQQQQHSNVAIGEGGLSSLMHFHALP